MHACTIVLEYLYATRHMYLRLILSSIKKTVIMCMSRVLPNDRLARLFPFLVWVDPSSNHTALADPARILLSTQLLHPVLVVGSTDTAVALISDEDRSTCGSFEHGIHPLVKQSRGFVVCLCSDRLGDLLTLPVSSSSGDGNPKTHSLPVDILVRGVCAILDRFLSQIRFACDQDDRDSFPAYRPHFFDPLSVSSLPAKDPPATHLLRNVVQGVRGVDGEGDKNDMGFGI